MIENKELSVGEKKYEPNAAERASTRWILLLFVLCLAGYWSVTAAYLQGLTMDEPAYINGAMHAKAWIAQAFSDKTGKSLGQRLATMLQNDNIHLYWKRGHRNSPLVKLGIAFTDTVFSPFLPPLIRARMFTVLMAILLTVVLFRHISEEFSTITAFLTLLMLWSSPRFIGHSGLAATDVTATTFFVFSLEYFSRNKGKWYHMLICSFIFGLALATKASLVILYPVCILWIVVKRDWKLFKSFSLLLTAPLVVILCSPWYWHHTLTRFFADWHFFFSHFQVKTLYWGVLYHRNPPPWHYPLVMLAITSPVLIILAFSVKVVRLFKKPFNPIISLHFIAVCTWLVVVMLPSSPKYDGIRLLLPLYPSLCFISALFLSKFLKDALHRITQFHPVLTRNRVKFRWAIHILLIVYFAVIPSVQSPYFLEYYNSLIGGVNGADVRGFEISYWGDVISPQLVKKLNSTLPEEARLAVLPFIPGVERHLRRNSAKSQWLTISSFSPLTELRKDVFITPINEATHVLLFNRAGFLKPAHRRYLRDLRSLMRISVKGTPLVTLIEKRGAFAPLKLK